MIPLYSLIEFQNAKSREKLPLQCKQCGKTFYKGKNEILRGIKGTKRHDFCSRRCNDDSNLCSVVLVCNCCGKEFLKYPSQIKRGKHNFCSQSCSAIYSNTHKTKGTRCSKLEKWLQIQLHLLYPSLEFHFNRKDAINSELDIYIPTLKLAFELNGIFHYEPIYGPEKLSKTKNNDNRKMQACYEQGIELCILDTSTQKYFKEQSSMKFLDIIKKIISLKIQSVSNETV